MKKKKKKKKKSATPTKVGQDQLLDSGVGKYMDTQTTKSRKILFGTQVCSYIYGITNSLLQNREHNVF